VQKFSDESVKLGDKGGEGREDVGGDL